ncbi:hypothetical protein [Bacillus pumilus]|uniref:hypothetical protein n=1 Tax=Bacillus pumilus TaxID=1408 RepID=UPI0031F57CFB
MEDKNKEQIILTEYHHGYEDAKYDYARKELELLHGIQSYTMHAGVNIDILENRIKELYILLEYGKD